MLKKVSALIIVLFILMISSAGVFANNDGVLDEKPDFDDILESVMKNTEAVDNESLILRITSPVKEPEKDKIATYSNSIILTGNSEYTDVVVAIARYNEGTEQYEWIENTDGESTWELGSFRMFSKTMKLKKGINNIKIISYRTTLIEEADQDNIQVNCFTIESLEKPFFTKLTETVKESFKSIFEKKND